MQHTSSLTLRVSVKYAILIRTRYNAVVGFIVVLISGSISCETESTLLVEAGEILAAAWLVIRRMVVMSLSPPW